MPYQVSCPLVSTEEIEGDFEKDVQDAIETWSVGGVACAQVARQARKHKYSVVSKVNK